ncbi:MAG: hypothetical protein AB7H48_04775 [Parachlamydiales bacterium]
MAFLLTAVKDSVTSYLWGSSPAVPIQPKTVDEVFKENILNISSMTYDDPSYEKSCIDSCIQVVAEDFKGLEFPLSETNCALIEKHSIHFNQCVDGTSYMDPSDAEKIKSQFKLAYSLFVEKQWTAAAAKSFYPILAMSNQEERISAAQSWTQDYFSGIGFFNAFENFAPVIVADFVARIVDRTTPALHAHCHEMIQQNMKKIGKRAETDPISFNTTMEAIDAKAKIDPNSLSTEEKEYIDFAENIAACITMHWPVVSKQTELLKKCVWHGFTLRQHNWSIVGTEMAQKLFASAFAEKL